VSGRSSVWLEYLVWDQGVEGSSPFAPTTFLFILLKMTFSLFLTFIHMVGLAQLVRALVCGAGGRGFESRIPPHL
jgi:hypothetical protein